jgi:hypothetical protein
MDCHQSRDWARSEEGSSREFWKMEASPEVALVAAGEPSRVFAEPGGDGAKEAHAQPAARGLAELGGMCCRE